MADKVKILRDRFPRSILVTSSRGCYKDATRKTASVEFKLNAASLPSKCGVCSAGKQSALLEKRFVVFFLSLSSTLGGGLVCTGAPVSMVGRATLSGA